MLIINLGVGVNFLCYSSSTYFCVVLPVCSFVTFSPHAIEPLPTNSYVAILCYVRVFSMIHTYVHTSGFVARKRIRLLVTQSSIAMSVLKDLPAEMRQLSTS